MPINTIHLENVNKQFHNDSRIFTALDKVNLKINPGEYVAIVGKSGSGKSTLLNMITGIDYPTTGTIKIGSSIINEMNENQLTKWRGRHIGIVFQFFQLIPTLTIAENLLLAMEFVGRIPKSDRLNRVRSLLTDVGIEDQADKLPTSLSGGQQQRAAIARALANDPEIIIADEPTGNLDSKTSSAINALLKSLSVRGKTVIIVTHESDLANRFDKIITLKDGKIIKA